MFKVLLDFKSLAFFKAGIKEELFCLWSSAQRKISICLKQSRVAKLAFLKDDRSLIKHLL